MVQSISLVAFKLSILLAYNSLNVINAILTNT